MKRLLFIFVLSIASSIAFGQYSDERLFADYLRQDLTSWGEYIDATNWDDIDTDERLRLVNYEYGWIATAIDIKSPKAAEYLQQFRAHIEVLHGIIPESTYLTYLSSAHAYEYMLDKSKLFSSGLKSFNLCHDAVDADDNDPIALTLKGNVDFYAPKAFGGSKKKALNAFLKAERIFHKRGGYEYLWNYWSMQLCIAQCYEKTDRLDDAIERCEKILSKNPNFLYIKDEYLPALLEKQRKK